MNVNDGPPQGSLTRGVAPDTLTLRPARFPPSGPGPAAKSPGTSGTLSVSELQKDLVDHDRILAWLDDVLDSAEGLLEELGWIGIGGTRQSREGAAGGTRRRGLRRRGTFTFSTAGNGFLGSVTTRCNRSGAV